MLLFLFLWGGEPKWGLVGAKQFILNKFPKDLAVLKILRRRNSSRIKGGEPQGVRRYFLSKKVCLCFKKVLEGKKGF